MTTILAVILLFIWPMVFSGIVAFGEWLVGFGSFGAFYMVSLIDYLFLLVYIMH